MATDDDIRTGPFEAAASIDAGDSEAAQADVLANVRRRRTRTRLGVALGAVALFAGGAVAVTSLNDSDSPDTLVSVDATVVEQPEDTAPTETTDNASPADVAAQAVTVLDRPGIVGVAAGTDDSPGYAEWSVPWRDGFLVGSTTYAPQPLPTQLPDDVRALFPQEVLDLFAEGLPPTIAEATTMLSDAGLLDEVTAVISAHPEASEAIYAAPAPDPVIEARFTRDGRSWEPVEFELPAGRTTCSSWPAPVTVSSRRTQLLIRRTGNRSMRWSAWHRRPISSSGTSKKSKSHHQRSISRRASRGTSVRRASPPTTRAGSQRCPAE